MVRMLHGLGAVAWLVAAARAATNCSDGSWSTPRDELGARFLDYGGIEAAAGQREDGVRDVVAEGSAAGP